MAREIVRKFADQILVYSDWEGFREAALPGDLPAGLLRWVSRYIGAMGVIDGVWWIPLAVLALANGFLLSLFFRRAWAKAAMFVLAAAHALYPVLGIGAGVWLVEESAAYIMDPLGLCAGLLLFISLRRLAKCAFWGAPAACAVCAALWIPLGMYALAAGACLAVAGVLRGRGDVRARFAVWPVCAIPLVLAPPLTAKHVYGDIPCDKALDASCAFRLRWNSPTDLRSQLAMERAVVEGDFGRVLEIADEEQKAGKPSLRMGVAYRILAQYRLMLLPDDLFKYPMPTSHVGTDAEESMMDGYVLLFNYGLLMPARREIYEIASIRGWQPVHFRLLGDIAAVCGELQLARRYYSQYARCPFRGDFAARRLKALKDSDGAAFSDIAPIADMHETWKRFFAAQSVMYFNTTPNFEEFVYTHFRALKAAPDMMVRMCFSAALLAGDETIYATNLNLLDAMGVSPAKGGNPLRGNPWSVPAQEAVLMYLNRLGIEEKQQFIAKIRPGAIEQDTVSRFNDFMSKPQQATLSNPHATSYFFYRSIILPPVEDGK